VLEGIFVVDHERANGSSVAGGQAYPPRPDLVSDRPDVRPS
jgi:hypothetical protein